MEKEEKKEESKKVEEVKENKGAFDKVKEIFVLNKLAVILGVCNVIPMLICLALWTNNVLLSLFIVPIVYRYVSVFVLTNMSKKGRPQNITLFTIVSRASVFLGFFIPSIVTLILGINESGFVSTLILCVGVAFFDKILIFLLKLLFKFVFKVSLPATSSLGNKIQSVDALLDNTASSFTQPNGDVVYQDKDGYTIGMSSTNPNGSKSYYNRDMSFVGTSNSTNGVERYYDKDLSYKGQSEKDARGDTVFHDKDLNYKGRSNKNSNGTTTFHK